MNSTVLWPSALFLLPIVVAVLIGLAMFLGADVDASTEVEVESAPAGELEGEAEGSFLSLLGFGRAPVAVVVSTLLASFGGAGLALTYLLAPVVATPMSRLGLSAVAALFVSAATTRFIAELLARAIPTVETYATRPEQLVGRIGSVVVPVSRSFGIVRVADETGAMHQIECRSYSEGFPAGSTVIVTEHDAVTGRFVVDENPL